MRQAKTDVTRLISIQMAIVESTEQAGQTPETAELPDISIDSRRPMQWQRGLECVYAAALISVLTVGTVTAFWRGRLQEGGPSLETVSNYTFLLAQLPALILLGRRISARHTSQPVLWFLGGLLTWLMLSITWSTVKSTTLVAAVALVVTCCVGLYLALSFSWTELATLVFIGLQPGLIASRLANDRVWAGSIDETGNLAGIYGNRNSLGPPAVLAAAMGAVVLSVLVMHAWRRRAWRYLPVVAAVWGLVLFDVDMQRASRSATSWVVLLLTVSVVVLYHAVAATPWFNRRAEARAIIAGVILVGATAAFALAVALQSRVSELFDRSPGFDSRTSYWRVDFHGVRAKPVFGWGWFAAWRTPEFRSFLPINLSDQIWSHSAYFDVVLGGGLVAVVLGAGLAVAGSRSAASAMNRHDPASALPLALVVAIGFACTQESFFVGNHFYTALLVAGLCAGLARDPATPDVGTQD